MKIQITDTDVQVIKDYRIVLLIKTASPQKIVDGLLVIMGTDTKVVDLRI